MFNPIQFYEAGKARSGTALIPLKDVLNTYFVFSTRVGDAVVDKGNGTSPISYTTGKMLDFTTVPTFGKGVSLTYSSAFTGNASIKFLKGLKDVYSFATSNNSKSKLNITDLETFFKQFPNLYSVLINEQGSSVVIKGDLSRFPDSVERVSLGYIEMVNVGTDLVLNFSNYNNNSLLKYFRSGSEYLYFIKVVGDLGKFPETAQYLYIAGVTSGSVITYTAGKVWASSFDTLYLPIPLTPTENDNLLIDANNSVTTAIGGKLFDLKGFRTLASDIAVAGLIALGFTVNCTRISDTMLTMPLSANLLDSSSYSNNATMVGTETHSLGGLVTSTGNYAYIPNKTSLDFGTGSLRFGCTVKFSAITGLKGLIGKTIAGSAIGRYGIYLYAGNLIAMSQITSGTYETSTSATPYNDGNFHTIEVICDRTTGKQKLIIDGVLINTTSFTPSSDNLSRNAYFIIGGYGNATGNGLQVSSELSGIIKDVFVNKF